MEIAISRHHRNQLNASHAREDIEREVARFLCPHRMEILGRGPMRAELYGVALHRASLLELCYGRETSIAAGDLVDQYLFRTTLAGRCELESGNDRVSISAGDVSVSSPTRSARIHTDRECRNLLLRIDRQALELKLAEMLQATLREPLVFDLSIQRAHAGASMFQGTLRYLCALSGQIDASAKASVLGPDLTQWLMTVLLTQLRHSYSDALARGALAPLPSHVRRARDYINVHLGDPLPLEALAREAGVSPRTLQNGFRQFLDTTPAAYIRDRRLEAVHAALRCNPSRAVTDVLIEYGVNSFGHFAKAYARRYGCLPSATARRAV
jgi:AraC-like DNA-binding protein